MSVGTSRRTERDEEQLLLWPDTLSTPQVKKKPPNKRKITKRIALLRLENIRLLVQLRFNGDADRLVKQLSPSHAKAFETVWLGEGSRYPNESLARRIEVVCGLDRGWLDLTHGDPNSLATKITALNGRARRAVTEVVEALLQAR